MTLAELQRKRKSLDEKSDASLRNMQKIADESNRVADVAHHSHEILDDLDHEFESQTGLQGNDVKFLFAATGLQVARIVIMNQLTKIEPAGSGNKKESQLHEFQQNLLEKFDSGSPVKEKPYYASMEHIISTPSVPYDATATLTAKQVETMAEKRNRTWDFPLDDLIPTENPKLFKGANHRFSTMGHDPVLGLVFGTGNIMTNTITCVKSPLSVAGLQVPVLTTNHVVYSSDFKDPRIATYGSTVVMLEKMFERIVDQPAVFAASLIKQIIHIGTDMYTPCGIQIPAANLVLTNTNAEKLTQYISTGDIVKAGTSYSLSLLINCVISTLHMLMYDSSMPVSRDVYNVRTRKIIMYSNAIASGSNAIVVGARTVASRDITALKDLDIGGLIVTVNRLTHDPEYIRSIKEEFVLGGFRKMIQGEDLDLEEINWR